MTVVVGVASGPEPGGRTTAAVAGVLAGAAAAGATTSLVELARSEHAEVARAFAGADAIVLGSPVYRASHSAALKALLEATERGRWGERTKPLQGKAAAIVLTGASPHHFLAGDELRNVLAGFFAVQVLSPGLYLDHAAYADRATLGDSARELTAMHGTALVELAAAVRGSSALRALEPLV